MKKPPPKRRPSKAGGPGTSVAALVARRAAVHAKVIRVKAQAEAFAPLLLGAGGAMQKVEKAPRTDSRKVHREDNAVVVRSRRAELLDAVADFASIVEQRLESDEAVVAGLASSPHLPRAEHLEQLRRNAELRIRFMTEVPLLTSADVAKISGSSARNASAKASRWKSERRVFSVNYGGVDHYPAFQFDAKNGSPMPAMSELLEVLGELSDWQIALWFFAPNAWLGDQSPMDVVAKDPAAVIDAARRAVEPLEV